MRMKLSNIIIIISLVDLERGVCQAIAEVREVVPGKFHEEVTKMYSWNDVAARTEIVYQRMMNTTSLPLMERLRRYYGCGIWAGKLFCFFVAIDYIVYVLLEWLFPRDTIDLAVNFPYEKYQYLCRHADQKNSKDQ